MIINGSKSVPSACELVGNGKEEPVTIVTGSKLLSGFPPSLPLPQVENCIGKQHYST